MKKLKEIGLLLTVICLVSSCSKEIFEEDLAGVDLKCRRAHSEVFVVYPGGGDDTPALLQAFADAKAAGPGSVVQLSEGEYNLGFLEIREFRGKFLGAGEGRTVITCLNDLDISPLTGQVLNTYLIKFVGGDVYMRGMTIKTPPGTLTTSDEWWIEGLVCFSARNRQYVSEDDYIKATVDNVSLIAGSGLDWKSNCNTGIFAGFDSRLALMDGGWPLSPVDLTITNCYFENCDLAGVMISYVNGGKIVAGNRNCGNVFKDNSCADFGYGGSISFWHNINMVISIVDNIFNVPSFGWFGVEITDSPWPGVIQDVVQRYPTLYNVERNKFNVATDVGGILIRDPRRLYCPDDKPMLGQVRNNSFNLDESFAAIGCFYTVGLEIRSNKLSGSTAYGVRIMGEDPLFNENGLMLGNFLSGTSFSEAAILLNAGSRNWTIRGSIPDDSVINLGENNQILGMAGNHHNRRFRHSFDVNHKLGRFEHGFADNHWDMNREIHGGKNY